MYLGDISPLYNQTLIVQEPNDIFTVKKPLSTFCTIVEFGIEPFINHMKFLNEIIYILIKLLTIYLTIAHVFLLILYFN